MEVSLVLLVTVVIIALVFDFTNGFHDAANAIATVVSTHAMSLKTALLMAAVMNVAGAFFATEVATTIEKGIIRDVGTPLNAQLIVLSALVGAIAWNITTWYFGMPSSSSHAIVGGLVGAGVTYGHAHGVIWTSIMDKVLIPMLLSPIFGAMVAALIMGIIYLIFLLIRRERQEHIFRPLQIMAGAIMAFSHGSNDAQKTMGVITLALIGGKVLPANSPIPWWVVILCAVTMGLGTLAGGRRIIETTGKKITILDQENGFAANIGASITILLCSRFGLPVSTTHVVIGCITGAGLVRDRKKINLGTWGSMLVAWICTIPGAAGFAVVTYLVLERFLVPLL
ncbi:MAG: hypothetical protein BGO12_08670 [Verrucomicrobia bacterium 61-8]|nr:inorganic phosphate transporter [Verrucomicrobiota bacterium]OJV10124.1 MAG: hypothetical protein BGO12_08670 [Verrucomicrobia bacterium 61-8]